MEAQSLSVMLDLETFGTSPQAPVVQIAALPFDLSTGEFFATDGFYMTCVPDLRKYVSDYSTLKFWLTTTTPEARVAVFANEQARPLAEVLLRLRQWTMDRGLSKQPLWALPASFDIVILENAFRTEEIQWPWHYNVPRCLRTVYELAGITKDQRIRPENEHDAMSDAVSQVKTLTLALAKMRVLK